MNERSVYKVYQVEEFHVVADSPEAALHHVQDGRRSDVVEHSVRWTEAEWERPAEPSES